MSIKTGRARLAHMPHVRRYLRQRGVFYRAMRIPRIFKIVDAEHFLEEIRVLLDCRVSGNVHMMQDADIFSGDLNCIHFGVIGLTVPKEGCGWESVASRWSNRFYIRETTEMAVEAEDDGVQEQTFVAQVVDDIHVRVIRTRSTDGIAFVQTEICRHRCTSS